MRDSDVLAPVAEVDVADADSVVVAELQPEISFGGLYILEAVPRMITLISASEK